MYTRIHIVDQQTKSLLLPPIPNHPIIQVPHPSIQIRRNPQPSRIRRHQPERHPVMLPPDMHQRRHIPAQKQQIRQRPRRLPEHEEQRHPEVIQRQLGNV